MKHIQNDLFAVWKNGMSILIVQSIKCTFLSLTDVSTNEVFTFREAMKQEDRLDFVAAMERR